MWSVFLLQRLGPLLALGKCLISTSILCQACILRQTEWRWRCSRLSHTHLVVVLSLLHYFHTHLTILLGHAFLRFSTQGHLWSQINLFLIRLLFFDREKLRQFAISCGHPSTWLSHSGEFRRILSHFWLQKVSSLVLLELWIAWLAQECLLIVALFSLMHQSFTSVAFEAC